MKNLLGIKISKFRTAKKKKKDRNGSPSLSISLWNSKIVFNDLFQLQSAMQIMFLGSNNTSRQTNCVRKNVSKRWWCVDCQSTTSRRSWRQCTFVLEFLIRYATAYEYTYRLKFKRNQWPNQIEPIGDFFAH